MQKSMITAILLAASTVLAGTGMAQDTPASTPPAKTPGASTSTTAKTPAKKTGTTAKSTASAGTALTTKKQKFSYALGMNIGSGLGANLKKQSVEVDPAIVARGLKDALAGGKTQLTEEEAKAALTEKQEEVRKEQAAKAQEAGAANKKEGDAYLAANKAKPGVVTTASGLQYKIITAGTGPKPTASDSVVCNYKGTLINGKEFDSSYKRGQPATFGVGQVIKGWTEALQLMPVGSKWELVIPPDLAYGERGAGSDIGPDSTLIFEVELISIQDKSKEQKPADEKKPDEKKPEDKQK